MFTENASRPGGGQVPIERVLARLDRLLAAKQYNEAEDHLKYWLSEAAACGDRPARLTVLNELMGFYRRGGRSAEAIFYADTALSEYGADNEFSGTVFFATSCLNAGTVYEAAGDFERAVLLYEQCKTIYDRQLEPGDLRYAGLYNNLGLALTAVGEYARAKDVFNAALRIQEPLGRETALDRAITYLNLCDLAEAEAPDGSADPDTVDGLVEAAYRLFSAPDVPRDAYYAFVCEKCAPVFGYYGYFVYKAELEKAAQAINERAGSL